MSSKKNKKANRAAQRTLQHKRVARKELLRHFKPLIYAVASWLGVMLVIHLPAFHEQMIDFFVKFTIESVVLLGKLTFIPIYSREIPFITVSGYPMVVIMECTAYNFYIFVVFLSLFSPIKWSQRLITLAIFLPSVFVINSLRFITMGYIGIYYPKQFDNIHDYLWNILFGFLIFLIWVWRYHKQIPKLNAGETRQVA